MFKDVRVFAAFVAICLFGLFGVSALFGRDVLNATWATFLGTIIGGGIAVQAALSAAQGGKQNDNRENGRGRSGGGGKFITGEQPIFRKGDSRPEDPPVGDASGSAFHRVRGWVLPRRGHQFS